MASDAADRAGAAATAATAAQTTASQVAQAAAPAIGAGARDRAELRAMIEALQADAESRERQVTALQNQLAGVQLTPGPAGQSAYEAWKAAGNTGTAAQFLASLVGAAGANASTAQVAQAVSAYLAANPPTPGMDGKSAELRVNGANVEWRQVGGTWSTLVPLSAISGARGTSGTNGVDGKSAELRISGSNLEWRQAGGAWTTLVPLSAIAGPAGSNGTNGSNGVDGKSVELQKTTTAIQWRQSGGAWADLVPLSALKGADGTPADMSRVEALEIAVAALKQPAGKLSGGQAPVPALALGASTTVQVPLTPAQTNTDFTVSAFVVGGTNVMTMLSIQSTAVVSGSRVDVTVKTAGLLTAGAAQVLVIAHRP